MSTVLDRAHNYFGPNNTRDDEGFKIGRNEAVLVSSGVGDCLQLLFYREYRTFAGDLKAEGEVLNFRGDAERQLLDLIARRQSA